MAICYDLNLRNFYGTSLVVKNEHGVKHINTINLINESLRYGFITGIWLGIKCVTEPNPILRKKLIKIKNDNYNIIKKRFDDKIRLTFLEFITSEVLMDKKALLFMEEVYPESKNKKTILNRFNDGVMMGILYQNRRHRKDMGDVTYKKIKDTDLNILIKEMNHFIKTYKIKNIFI